jgi:hypothetical protein
VNLRKVASYTEIAALAETHGWTRTEKRRDRAHTDARFERDDERVTLTVWHETDNIPAGFAELAAGRVKSVRRELSWYGHAHRHSDVAAWFTGKRASDYPASMWVVEVEDTDSTYRNYRYETASAYDEVKLTPGMYPIECVGGEVLARIPGTVVREYYENRLLTASSVHDEKVCKPTALMIRTYGNAPDLGRTYFDGIARIRLAEEV